MWTCVNQERTELSFSYSVQYMSKIGKSILFSNQYICLDMSSLLANHMKNTEKYK